jgi:hypothetical protein
VYVASRPGGRAAEGRKNRQTCGTVFVNSHQQGSLAGGLPCFMAQTIGGRPALHTAPLSAVRWGSPSPRETLFMRRVITEWYKKCRCRSSSVGAVQQSQSRLGRRPGAGLRVFCGLCGGKARGAKQLMVCAHTHTCPRINALEAATSSFKLRSGEGQNYPQIIV